MGRVLAVIVIIVLAVAYVVVQLARPVGVVTATASPVAATMPGTPATLAWPTQGEAAVGVEGVGVLDSHGSQLATPLASVTKMMTAYVVLHDHPLGATTPGTTITVSPADVTTYEQDLADGNSVVAVQAGERLTEQQALEALLVPSGDNIATLLADWDAGSEAAFVVKMNAEAKELGLAGTHYADASGVAPGSVSTAASQVRLAMVDMQLPALRNIVDMPQVTLPVAGVQYNVDALLGKHGIVGVKTGYTTSAGGCFVFAARATVGGTTRTIVGAVLHQVATAAQPSALTAAFDASVALLQSTESALEEARVLREGEALGHLHAPWATPVALESSRSVSLMGLPGQRVTTRVVLPSHLAAPAGVHERFGTAVVRLGTERVSVPLVTSRPLPAVSIGWRLTNV